MHTQKEKRAETNPNSTACLRFHRDCRTQNQPDLTKWRDRQVKRTSLLLSGVVPWPRSCTQGSGLPRELPESELPPSASLSSLCLTVCLPQRQKKQQSRGTYNRPPGKSGERNKPMLTSLSLAVSPGEGLRSIGDVCFLGVTGPLRTEHYTEGSRALSIHLPASVGSSLTEGRHYQRNRRKPKQDPRHTQGPLRTLPCASYRLD